MQEYWINVYYIRQYGAKHTNKSDADVALKMFGALYRIHVKMDGGYNRKKHIKIFGVDIPGVYMGDGAYKPYLNKYDRMK